MKDLYRRNRELKLYEDDLSMAKNDHSLLNPTLDRFYIFLDAVTNNESDFSFGDYRIK